MSSFCFIQWKLFIVFKIFNNSLFSFRSEPSACNVHSKNKTFSRILSPHISTTLLQNLPGHNGTPHWQKKSWHHSQTSENHNFWHNELMYHGVFVYIFVRVPFSGKRMMSLCNQKCCRHWKPLKTNRHVCSAKWVRFQFVYVYVYVNVLCSFHLNLVTVDWVGSVWIKMAWNQCRRLNFFSSPSQLLPMGRRRWRVSHRKCWCLASQWARSEPAVGHEGQAQGLQLYATNGHAMMRGGDSPHKAKQWRRSRTCICVCSMGTHHVLQVLELVELKLAQHARVHARESGLSCACSLRWTKSAPDVHRTLAIRCGLSRHVRKYSGVQHKQYTARKRMYSWAGGAVATSLRPYVLRDPTTWGIRWKWRSLAVATNPRGIKEASR